MDLPGAYEFLARRRQIVCEIKFVISETIFP